MFILSSFSRGVEFLLVSHISIYEHSELKVFKSIKVLREVYNNFPNNLLRTYGY